MVAGSTSKIRIGSKEPAGVVSQSCDRLPQVRHNRGNERLERRLPEQSTVALAELERNGCVVAARLDKFQPVVNSPLDADGDHVARAVLVDVGVIIGADL